MKRLTYFVKNNPHWLAGLYYIFYLIVFVLLEQITVPRVFIHCRLDDMIPFCEWFFIPYCMWFLLMPATLILFAIKDKSAFFEECFMMFGGMTICLILYFLVPNGINIRVDIPDRNLLCALVSMLQSMDPPTNVCPSIHVSSTVSIVIASYRSHLLREKRFALFWIFALGFLIVLSTVFLKQHSVIDVAFGLLLSIIMLWLCAKTSWKDFLKQTPLSILFEEHL